MACLCLARCAQQAPAAFLRLRLIGYGLPVATPGGAACCLAHSAICSPFLGHLTCQTYKANKFHMLAGPPPAAAALALQPAADCVLLSAQAMRLLHPDNVAELECMESGSLSDSEPEYGEPEMVMDK